MTFEVEDSVNMSDTANHSTDAGKGFKISPLYYLLLAIPVAIALRLLTALGVIDAGVGQIATFVFSGIAIIPLAGLMGRATENLAETMGAGIGGLLNATFGNAAELIIALIALWYGQLELVKASITGSIICNILLVLGLSMLVGGFFRKKQTFNRTAAGMGATLMALACVGLLIPTLYYHLFHEGPNQIRQETKRVLRQEKLIAPEKKADAHAPKVNHDAQSSSAEVIYLSEEIAVILAVVYLLSLVFSLKTHQHLFAGPEGDLPTTGEHHQPEWSRRTSFIVLIGATVGVAVMAEFLVASVEYTALAFGMNHVFIGVIVVAVIGNAAEHSTAILVAAKDKMDLAYNIAVGSSIQIALFVAPVLVFASLLMCQFAGHTTMLDLHFTPLEIVAVIVSIAVVALVAQDGESHWMEGVMLLAVYIIIGLAFFHLPSMGGH